MNIRAYHQDHRCFFNLQPQPELQKQKQPWGVYSGLGQAMPGALAGCAGLVGSVLGQMLCPVPFVGAMLGGMIGSLMGSLMEALSGMSTPCCGPTMGHQYGQMNQQMAGCYGYPQYFHDDYPVDSGYRPTVPAKFPNPSYGQSPPLFCPEPPVSQDCSMQLGLLPWGNTQVQSEVNRTTERAQVADSLFGQNRQVQENVVGHNRGRQSAANVFGSNEQVQRNVHGDNAGPQVAGTLIGSNEQRQENATGDNTGAQVARTTVGDNAQIKTTAVGQNVGDQTASTFLGSNTQVNIAGGAVITEQSATTHGGDNQQTIIGGHGSIAHQDAQTRNGNNDQTLIVGDASIASQDAQTTNGNNVQRLEGGTNVIASQNTEGGGTATQAALVESGSVTQTGGNDQFAASLGGPVAIDQQGDQFGDNQQDARGGAHDDQIGQAAGQGFLTLMDNKTTANAELGAGNDRYTYEGNSEDNHLRLDGGQQTGPDQDVAQISTHGGNDTAVVNLSGDRDTYLVDLGRGNDRLVINEDGNRVRVLGEDGQEVYRSQGWTESDSTASVNGAENLTVYRPDGTFARWDETNGLQEGRDPGQPGEMSPVAAARTLREYAGELDKAAGTGEVDGIIGRADMRAALENPETPQELREAIQYTLGNEAMWRGIDASGGRGDRVDLAGLNSFIDGYETRPSYDASAPMSDSQATSVLNYHNALLDTAGSGGGADGRFNLDDLRAITGDGNQNLPPELRAAAQHLLSNSSYAERLDNASWEMGVPFAQQTFTNEDLARFGG